jgi:uncharacterized protein
MPAEINVRQFKNVDLGGGWVIEAIPSVGLVSTIASTYIISTLGLDQVAAIDSDDFPPLSMIYGTKPKFPARVYASEEKRVAVFICEVPLPGELHRPLARTLLAWADEHKAEQIIGLEGLPLPKGAGKEEVALWAVGSTDVAREAIEKSGIAPLETGMISGVAGVLLNEGRWMNFDVIALLAEARAELPDAFAASKLVEGADKLLPHIEIELGPLVEQAKALENHLNELQTQAQPIVKKPTLGQDRMFG